MQSPIADVMNSPLRNRRIITLVAVENKNKAICGKNL